MTDKIAWGVAGVLGLGTLAYLYDIWHKKSKEKYTNLDKKLKALKTLRVPGTNNFNTDALTKFITYVTEESEKEFIKAGEGVANERRTLLKHLEYEEYFEVCQDSLDLQKEIEEDFLKRALDKMGVEREEYEEELQKLPPQTLQMIMANKGAPKSGEGVKVPYKLDKAKTKKIFLEITSLQDRTNEKYKDLFEKLEEVAKKMDQMAGGQFVMGVMQLLVTDILWNDYKVKEEEYSAALQLHHIMEDPEIVRIMQQKAAMYQMMMMMGGGQG